MLHKHYRGGFARSKAKGQAGDLGGPVEGGWKVTLFTAFCLLVDVI